MSVSGCCQVQGGKEVYELAQVIITRRKKPNNSGPGTNNLPRKLTRNVLAVSTQTKTRGKSNNRHGVSDHDWVIRVLLDSISSLLSCLLRLLLLLMELLLQSLLLGDGLGLKRLLVVLNALALGLGFDGLGLEVVWDGVDLGGVDVDKGRGWSVFGWNYGGWGWGASLGCVS